MAVVWWWWQVVYISLYTAHPPSITIIMSIARVSMRFLEQQTQSFTPSDHSTQTASAAQRTLLRRAGYNDTDLSSRRERSIATLNDVRWGEGLASILQVKMHYNV
jgi:hypothetical protein